MDILYKNTFLFSVNKDGRVSDVVANPHKQSSHLEEEQMKEENIEVEDGENEPQGHLQLHSFTFHSTFLLQISSTSCFFTFF